MSETLTLKGTIKLIGETQEFSSGFTKREFVITTDDKYPQDIKLEFVKDGCAKLDNVGIGQEVSVAFNVRGNEHQGRYYVNLQAWKLEAGEGFNQEERSQLASNTTTLNDDDDIPF